MIKSHHLSTLYIGLLLCTSGLYAQNQSIPKPQKNKSMSYTLPALPYAPNALEPEISAKTIAFHYGKHHQAYVDNLNKLVAGTPWEGATLEEIILKAEGPIFNNAAQIWNHTFYWNCLSAEAHQQPQGALKQALEAKFGSIDEFKKQFLAAATSVFGSGWTWLVKDSAGDMSILSTSNAGNPLREGLIPLLTIDVWEHAYYVDVQNRRPAYLENVWSRIDWNSVATRFEKL